MTFSPLFSAGTARGGTNLLTQLLSVNRAVSLAADPYLPLFRSLRNAVARRGVAAGKLGRFDPNAPLGEYYFREEALRLQDLIQAADLAALPFDRSERVPLREALAARTALSSGYLIGHLPRLETAKNYRELFEQALELIAIGRGARDREWVGFNENWAIEFFAPLARAFPKARFLAIVRDPRAAIASNRLAPNPAVFAHVLSFARCWRKTVAYALHYRADPLFAGRFHLLTYEQLVRDPRGTALELCSFLGIDFDPGMLDTNRYLDLSTGGTWAGNSQYKPVLSGIDPAHIDRWRGRLAGEIARTVEFACHAEMRWVGLAPSTDVDPGAADPAVLQYLIETNTEPCKWSTHLGDPQQDYGFEVFRNAMLRLPERPGDTGLIRRSFLFEEAYDRLREGRPAEAIAG